MTDPKEIEGSPERAADRGRAEDLGFPTGPKPSLGNIDVVRGLVSEFASQVVGVRKQYNAGKLDHMQAQERIFELAQEYGNIIMGADASYAAMPWNDASHLGAHIRLAVPGIDGIDEPGLLLFLTVGASLAEIAAAHEAGRLSDASGEHQTKVMLEDAAALIAGVR